MPHDDQEFIEFKHTQQTALLEMGNQIKRMACRIVELGCKVDDLERDIQIIKRK